jgi:methyl-accepting chemotaxis protein
MVKEKYGEDKWQEILKRSEMDNAEKYLEQLNGLDLADGKVFEILKNTCQALQINAEQAAHALGEYWFCVYAPKLYKSYYKKYQSARDFIMAADHIHVEATKNVENAQPPHFDIEELDENRIKVHYKSKRKMIDFLVGVVQGAGKYFNTPLDVKKISDEYVEIHFRP